MRNKDEIKQAIVMREKKLQAVSVEDQEIEHHIYNVQLPILRAALSEPESVFEAQLEVLQSDAPENFFRSLEYGAKSGILKWLLCCADMEVSEDATEEREG